MEDWKEYKLGELLTIKYGKDHKKLKDGDIPAYGSGGVMRWVNQAIYNGPSIMIPRKGSLNNILYSEKPFWTVDTMFWSIINDNIVNPIFLYYSIYKKDFASLNVGSAVPSLTIPILNDIKIKVPSSDIQNKIISILKPLDDKIELNRRINGNLEQQAQALYAKAFSSTNTCKMGDVVETTSGGTPSRKNQNYFSSQGIKWIKSKELNGSFIFDSEEHISNDGLCNSSAKLLPPNSTLIAMYGATVGAYGLTIDNATCNQAICALLPNSQYPYTYLYMWAKNNKDELIQKAIGSAQQNISQIIIKNMPVANEKDKIIRFDSDTRYIFSLMRSLAKENYNLIALRDALLPRLMSGELKFNDLNR